MCWLQQSSDMIGGQEFEFYAKPATKIKPKLPTSLAGPFNHLIWEIFSFFFFIFNFCIDTKLQHVNPSFAQIPVVSEFIYMPCSGQASGFFKNS